MLDIRVSHELKWDTCKHLDLVYILEQRKKKILRVAICSNTQSFFTFIVKLYQQSQNFLKSKTFFQKSFEPTKLKELLTIFWQLKEEFNTCRFENLLKLVNGFNRSFEVYTLSYKI